jgi:hypothetical protein
MLQRKMEMAANIMLYLHILSLLLKYMVWHKTLRIQYYLYCPSGSCILAGTERGQLLRPVVTEWQNKNVVDPLIAYARAVT